MGCAMMLDAAGHGHVPILRPPCGHRGEIWAGGLCLWPSCVDGGGHSHEEGQAHAWGMPEVPELDRAHPRSLVWTQNVTSVSANKGCCSHQAVRPCSCPDCHPGGLRMEKSRMLAPDSEV